MRASKYDDPMAREILAEPVTHRGFGVSFLRLNGRIKATRPLGADLIVQIDSAHNQVIQFRPVAGGAS